MSLLQFKGKLHSKIISSDMRDFFSVESNGEGPRSKFEQEDGQTDGQNGRKISGDDAARPAWVMVLGVSSSRLRPDSDQSRIWCRARPWLGCDSLNELTWVSFVVHWYLTIFFFFFFFLSFRECCLTRQWQSQGTWYSGRSSMLSSASDSWLIDIGERSHPNPMHRRPIRCSSATSKTGNGFGWSFFFAVWRWCARSQLHMNSVVLVESHSVKEAALWFESHGSKNLTGGTTWSSQSSSTDWLTRTRHWSSPRSKLAYKKPTKYQKVTKIPVTSGQGSKHRDWTAYMRHDDERDDDRSHRRVSIM